MEKQRTLISLLHPTPTLETVVIDLKEDSESHLFRHASEITRETKGGYLQGKITIPKSQQPCYIRISLAPAQVEPKENPLNLHPNMLHVNMRQNKKNRKLEDGELPDDVDWSFQFKIDKDGSVYRVCPAKTGIRKRFEQNREFSESANSEPALNSEQSLLENYRRKAGHSKERPLNIGPLVLPENFALIKVTNLKDGVNLEMGTTGLMLNIITPLQKFSKGGTTLSDVMRQRFQDLFQREMSKNLLKQVEDVYTKRKEDRVKLQRVKLTCELFRVNPELAFVTSAMSQIITNSKSKECGPLQLHDINPAASCIRGNTKVTMLSFFKIVSEVKAAFVLWNPAKQVIENDEQIHNKLNQPDKDKCSVFNQCVLVCVAPEQDWSIIQQIRDQNLELRITAYRPSDGRMSKKSFVFNYLPHGAGGKGECQEQDPNRLIKGEEDWQRDIECGLCEMQKFNTQGEDLPLAKPGVPRRQHDTSRLEMTASKPFTMSVEAQQKRSKSQDTVESQKDVTFFVGNNMLELKVEPHDILATPTIVDHISSGTMRCLAPPKKRRVMMDQIQMPPAAEVVPPVKKHQNGHVTLPTPMPMNMYHHSKQTNDRMRILEMVNRTKMVTGERQKHE